MKKRNSVKRINKGMTRRMRRTRRKVSRRKYHRKRTKRLKMRGGSDGVEVTELKAIISVEDGVKYKTCPKCEKKSKLTFVKLDSHNDGCIFKTRNSELDKRGLETGFDEQMKVFYIRKKGSEGSSMRHTFLIPPANVHNTSDSEIYYEDDNVCILRPEVKRGILIFTNFNQPGDIEDLCTSGLKSAEQLHKEGLQFGRSARVTHPYIFFRAPYYSTECDYSSIDSEIESSFGTLPEHAGRGRIFVRVDPDKTFVYPSELRVICDNQSFSEEKKYRELNKAKKNMSDYLKMIKENREWIKMGISFWDLLTYEYVNPDTVLQRELTGKIRYPYDNSCPFRNSEILVQLPHLMADAFVKCDHFS